MWSKWLHYIHIWGRNLLSWIYVSSTLHVGQSWTPSLEDHLHWQDAKLYSPPTLWSHLKEDDTQWKSGIQRSSLEERYLIVSILYANIQNNALALLNLVQSIVTNSIKYVSWWMSDCIKKYFSIQLQIFYKTLSLISIGGIRDSFLCNSFIVLCKRLYGFKRWCNRGILFGKNTTLSLYIYLKTIDHKEQRPWPNG